MFAGGMRRSRKLPAGYAVASAESADAWLGHCRLWRRKVTRAINEATGLTDLRSSMRRVRNLALTVI
jgi:hypothetical protein